MAVVYGIWVCHMDSTYLLTYLPTYLLTEFVSALWRICWRNVYSSFAYICVCCNSLTRVWKIVAASILFYCSRPHICNKCCSLFCCRIHFFIFFFAHKTTSLGFIVLRWFSADMRFSKIGLGPNKRKLQY